MARQSDIKNFQDLTAQLGKMDLIQPPVIIVSGEDADVFDMALDRVRAQIKTSGEELETTVLSGEAGDDARLMQELLNIPLFAPYRLFVVRQAADVLKSLMTGKKAALSALPDRTLLMLDYHGKLPAGVGKLFANSSILHLATRDLYENRVFEAIVSAEKRLGLKLSEDARQLLHNSVEKREGAVDRTLQRLKDQLPRTKWGSIEVGDVREILLPDVSFRIFDLVDALFARDMNVVSRELARFQHNSDSFFAVLKVMLSRADEIRRAAICRKMGMNDAQLAEQIGIKNRPPFVQKRILARLHQELALYDSVRLQKVYQLLIDLQFEFRSRVPPQRHVLVFSQRTLQLFFG